MNYTNPELLSLLAAEYVVGSLRGRARDRFERLIRNDQTIAREVGRWEQYLDGLNATVAAVEPPRSVWNKIEHRLFASDPDPAIVGRLIPSWWRNLALAASLLSLALAAYIVVPILQPERLAEQPASAAQNYVAVLQAEDKAIWSVRVDSAVKQLIVNAVAVPTIKAEQDYELWLLRDNDQTPVSLGLLPATGKITLALPDEDLSVAQGIAVSLEPRGGSPTGLPTGPVLYVAGLVEAG